MSEEDGISLKFLHFFLEEWELISLGLISLAKVFLSNEYEPLNTSHLQYSR